MPSTTAYVTANGIDLAIEGAWLLDDPLPLMGEGSPRGLDLTIAGAGGTTYRAKQRGPLFVALTLEVYGDNNAAGTPYADEVNGIAANIAYLRTNLLGVNQGLVTVTYTTPTAATYSSTQAEFLFIEPRSTSPIGNICEVGVGVKIHNGRLT